MFYTDGVVESRTKDFTAGIEWLRDDRRERSSRPGSTRRPRRILAQVESGDDDRAVLIAQSRAFDAFGWGNWLFIAASQTRAPMSRRLAIAIFADAVTV